MEELNSNDITIERVIAESELIRNREEKISLIDQLNAIENLNTENNISGFSLEEL